MFRAKAEPHSGCEAQAGMHTFGEHSELARERTMIHGAHVIIFSKDADADRAFFRDVLGFPFADAGHGWLVFALPPAELAVHPSDANDVHQLYSMCDDVHALVADMTSRSIPCSDIHEERWGSITNVTLPGGGKIGVYQPKHASPLAKPT